MKLIKCTQCGSDELEYKNGFLICKYCGAKYIAEPGDTGTETHTASASDEEKHNKTDANGIEWNPYIFRIDENGHPVEYDAEDTEYEDEEYEDENDGENDDENDEPEEKESWFDKIMYALYCALGGGEAVQFMMVLGVIAALMAMLLGTAGKITV